MGREVRIVKPNWKHPKKNGEYIPILEEDMPKISNGTTGHYMMYETCTEGTPISPAFETPEELARWLVENKASAFGSQTGTYEGWLRVAKGGYVPSAIYTPGEGIVPGVDYLKGVPND